METERTYKIGEIASMFNIPQQTLRYYDKLGVIKPSFVNEENGYRYYSIEETRKLHSLNLLKRMGGSVNEIRDLFSKEGTLPEMKENYGKLIEKIDDEVKHLSLLKNSIQNKLSELDQLNQQRNHFDIQQREEKVVYVKPVQIRSTEDQETECYRAFLPIASDVDFINTRTGFILEKRNFLNGESYATSFIIEGSSPIKGYHEHIIRKGTYLTLTIEDDYSKSFTYYNVLRAHIFKNDIEVLGDIYEFSYEHLPHVSKSYAIWQLMVEVNPLTLQAL
ncbi:MerR family transcriptional regulator [Shouchella sp. 1P09AA]|uniref:MerR family transcriptional regulator n=1 Tax=unclassified Shouchella TaxID=2893065 RepID=UPI0039A06582